MSMHIDYEINKELGECYLFMGEFDKAADYYRKAADAAPDNADPYMGLATIAVQKGALDEALALYAKAASLGTSDKALAGLALVEMETGRHEEAFEHFMAALNVNPGNMFAINGLVQEGYYLGKLEEIVPYLESALGSEDTESLRYALAGCLTALGRNSDARRQLEALLGMNPANQSAQELYARLAA